MKTLEKIVNSGRKVLETSLLVGALSVSPLLAGNIQAQENHKQETKELKSGYGGVLDVTCISVGLDGGGEWSWGIEGGGWINDHILLGLGFYFDDGPFGEGKSPKSKDSGAYFAGGLRLPKTNLSIVSAYGFARESVKKKSSEYYWFPSGDPYYEEDYAKYYKTWSIEIKHHHVVTKEELGGEVSGLTIGAGYHNRRGVILNFGLFGGSFW